MLNYDIVLENAKIINELIIQYFRIIGAVAIYGAYFGIINYFIVAYMQGEKAITTTFTYDKGGQLTGYTSKTGNKTKKTTYTYDRSGNKTAITKSKKEGITKAKYNIDNQIISETNSKTGIKIKYKYDKNGNLVSKTSNKKSKTVYEYDIENRLRAVSEDKQLIMAATYDGEDKQLIMAATYDGEDNKVFQMSRKYYDGGKTADITEQKKEIKRVKETKRKTGKNFDPDMFMFGFTCGSLDMSAAPCPAILGIITDRFKEVWHGITTFVTGDYEEVSRNVEDYADIVVPGTERGTLVTYDLTYYLNDINFSDNAEVMYQYDKNGNDKASYTYANDTRVAGDLRASALTYVSETAGDYSYLYDGLGNVVQDAKNGRLTNIYAYDPCGAVISGTEINDVVFTSNGEEYTEATGLQYLRARYLSTSIGRFLSEDPYEGTTNNIMTQNRYAYAENDPVNRRDPGGHKSILKTIGNGIKKAAKKVASVVKSAAKTIVNAVKSVINVVKDTAKAVVNKTESAVKATKTFIETTYKEGKNNAKKLTKALKEDFNSMRVKISCGAHTALTSAKDLFVEMLTPVDKYEMGLFKESGITPEQMDKNVENLHTLLDTAGTADPTPISDGLNALLYAGQGDWKNAAISVAGIVPYAGDAAKSARLGAKAVNLLDDVVDDSRIVHKPTQTHHFATNKNKTYTSRIKEITDKYGLDLAGDWNKQQLPHQGRHPNAYHDFVLDNITKIDNIANGDKEIFLDLFESEVKNPIVNNPDMLYKEYWNKEVIE